MNGLNNLLITGKALPRSEPGDSQSMGEFNERSA